MNLFITNRWAEVDRSYAWLAGDQQAWHFVEQRLASPWFHITVTRTQGEDTCVEVFFGRPTGDRAFHTHGPRGRS
jgi:hypothetical protein